jgi:hypothetical protein
MGNSTLYITAALLFAFTACQPDKSKHIPDVSHIELDWSMVRYEQELLNLGAQPAAKDLSELFIQHPVISNIYFRDILGLRAEADSLLVVSAHLLEQEQFRRWIDTCAQLFSDFAVYEDELRLGAKLTKHYFPERPELRFYTIVSEFSIGNFIFQDYDGRDGVGIGLDFFLGPEFPYVAMSKDLPAFSSYMSRTFTPDHITRKAFNVVIEDITGYNENPTNLLQAMLLEGKKQYALEHLVPFVHDTVLWELKPEQLAWLRDNEGAMWRHFLDEELLYNRDRTLIQKLTIAGPNSPGMPLEAPGRSAVFTGYQIVKNYHKRNPDLSLSDILSLTNAQSVLEAARYKPR